MLVSKKEFAMPLQIIRIYAKNRAVCKGNADKEDGKEHNANQCAQSSAVFIGKGPCKRKGN